MEFEWDEIKNEANFKKHGIWFEEAATTFADPYAIELFDRDNSVDEDRYILLGISSQQKLLTVVYCERQEALVRIISARKATKKEEREYERRI